MLTRYLSYLLLFLLLYQANAQNLPELNKKILAYTNSVIGTSVDRGECWDLANQALTSAGAKWDHAYVYGKKLNLAKDTIFPGDLIHFQNVTLKYNKGTTQITESMKNHTAIVYKIVSVGTLEIAHQNTGFSGKNVGISELQLSTLKKGRITFYRPY